MALPIVRAKVTADTSDAEAGFDRVGDSASRMGGKLRKAGADAKRAGADVSTMGAKMRPGGMFTSNIQNAAFQVGDFAVQVGSGTSAMRAMSQQLPQLLGGFGVWGAVAGAAAAIALPLVTYLSSGANNAEAFADALDDLNDQVDDYGGFAKSALASTEKLAQKFGDASGEAREMYRILAENRRLSVAEETQGLVRDVADPAGIGGTLKGMQAGAVAEFFNLDRQFLAVSREAKAARREIDELAQGVIDASNAMASASGIDEQIAATEQMISAYQVAADADGERSKSEREYIENLGETLLKLREVAEIDAKLAESLTAVEDGAEAAEEAVNGAVSQIPDKIAQTVPVVSENAAQVGAEMMNGVIAGIDMQMPLVTERIDAMAAEMDARMRGALEIQSPSKVFTRIGEFMGAGIAQGLQNSHGLVAAAVRQTSDVAVMSTDEAVSSILGSMGQLFEGSKPIATAQALINTWQGATEALKLPFPSNLAAFATTLATGFQAVNSIKSTNKSGGGGGGAGAPTAAAGGGGAAAPATSRNVAIQFSGGGMFSQEQVVGLINQINEAVEDGAIIRVV